MNSQRFVVYTLVDITNQGYQPAKGTTPEYRQSQNFNTLLQTLNLRGLLDNVVVTNSNESMTKHQFGEKHKGKKQVWCFMFTCESGNVWQGMDSEFQHAIKDLMGVPVYTRLQETAQIVDYFDTRDIVTKNTYFDIQ